MILCLSGVNFFKKDSRSQILLVNVEPPANLFVMLLDRQREGGEKRFWLRRKWKGFLINLSRESGGNKSIMSPSLTKPSMSPNPIPVLILFSWIINIFIFRPYQEKPQCLLIFYWSCWDKSCNPKRPQKSKTIKLESSVFSFLKRQRRFGVS